MDRRRLGVAAVAETVSLVLLLADLATVLVPSIASALGPVHGFCYLVVLALSWQLPAPTRVRLRSLVPAIGGLLVLRAWNPALGAVTRPGDAQAVERG